VNANATEDEITLEVTPGKPIGNGMLSVVKQNWLIKRAGNQLIATITSEYVGAASFMVALAQPDAGDATIKATTEQIEKFVEAEPGKCKPI